MTTPEAASSTPAPGDLSFFQQHNPAFNESFGVADDPIRAREARRRKVLSLLSSSSSPSTGADALRRLHESFSDKPYFPPSSKDPRASQRLNKVSGPGGISSRDGRQELNRGMESSIAAVSYSRAFSTVDVEVKGSSPQSPLSQQQSAKEARADDDEETLGTTNSCAVFDSFGQNPLKEDMDSEAVASSVSINACTTERPYAYLEELAREMGLPCPDYSQKPEYPFRYYLPDIPVEVLCCHFDNVPLSRPLWPGTHIGSSVGIEWRLGINYDDCILPEGQLEPANVVEFEHFDGPQDQHPSITTLSQC